ncbi:uncharacterized protein [Tenebrio molitor]|uniref:uncharacterized protein isoform X2 n=1 Tax=Tenebrio molitor TaxID=7067 RepID=UPI0036248D5D
MPITHLQIIGICLLILASAASKSKEEHGNLAVAKRSLIERERELFKSQPMSDDLRTFIEKYKRKEQKRSQDKRDKRSGALNENLLYVIHNGQLVPIKSLKDSKRSDDERRADVDSFTVVPLIIPIKAQDSKLVKTRTLDEELQSPPEKVSEAPGAASTQLPEKATKEKPESEEAEAGIDDENGNSTKEETQVLHKILQDVEGLMQSKHEGNKKEGFICNLNGSWISDAAGMRFDIMYKNSTRKKFRIHVADRIPPNEDGFLCDGNWTVFGELPFFHSGECRICEGSESVTGTWLVGRSSRDCKDQKAAHKILSDVWRREQGHMLRKKHLQQLGLNVNDKED